MRSWRTLVPALATGLLLAGCGGSDSTGGVVQPSTGVTLLDVQAAVFTPRCALSGCHVAAGGAFGLDLSSVTASRANLIDVPSGEIPTLMRVEPGNAANSYIYMKLSADPGIQGDPMPAIGDPLSAAELRLVRTWIDEGAL